MCKRGKRIVAILLCTIIVSALAGCGGAQPDGVEEAMESYFDAYNQMDMKAIVAASFPEGMEGYYTESLLQEGDYNFFENWRRQLGFYRSDFDYYGWLRFDPNSVVGEDYIEGYEGENGELETIDGQTLTLEEALPDFSIKYTIEEIAPFADCNVFLGYSGMELEDMDRIVILKDGSTLDVDEVYVAQVQIEWYYGDYLYGYNRDWWSDEEFCQTMLQDDYTYEDKVNEMAETDYILFVYKYNDAWYVYPENLHAASYLIDEVEFKME